MIAQLPNGLIRGWDVGEIRLTGTEGEELSFLSVAFEFELAGGRLAQQTFLIPRNLYKPFRDAVKRPAEIKPTTPDTEDPTQ